MYVSITQLEVINGKGAQIKKSAHAQRDIILVGTSLMILWRKWHLVRLKEYVDFRHLAIVGGGHSKRKQGRKSQSKV